MSGMRFYLTIFFILTITTLSAQNKVRLPLWTFNTTDTDVYGISVGYTTTDKIQNVKTNGLRFELLGLGFLLPLIPEAPIANSDSIHDLRLKTPYSEIINGVNLSPIGTGCDCKINGFNVYGVGSITGQVNGISAGFFINITERQNGIQSSIYFNIAYELNGLQLAVIGNRNRGRVRGIQIAAQNHAKELEGIQIGLYNRTEKINGVQIGLWNVNEKRKLPLINF